MSNKVQNLTINQGCSFSMVLNISDSEGNSISLTGYTARAQIRPGFADSYPNDFIQFTVNITPLLGTIELSLDATTTQGISFTKGLYDVELVDSSNKVTRILSGQVRIIKEITR